MQETLVVRREQHVPAPPAAVFALLTDPEKILRWMGTEAQVEPQPGGLYLVNVTGARFARGSAAALRQWARDYWQAVHPFDLAGAYPNFMFDDEGEARGQGRLRRELRPARRGEEEIRPGQPVPGESQHPAGALSGRRPAPGSPRLQPRQRSPG